MPAHRKLDQAAVERIVAGKVAGQSDRQIAAALGVSHTTVSRRIGADRELQARISAREREAQDAPERERPAAVKAGGEHGRPPGVRAEQPLFGRPAGAVEQEMWDRAIQVAQAQHAKAVPTPVDAAPPAEERQPPALAAPAQPWLRLLGFTSESERYAYHEQRSLISKRHLFDWHDVRAGRLTPAEKRTLRTRH